MGAGERIGRGGGRENCCWDVMSGRIKKKKRLSSWTGNRWEGREGLTDSNPEGGGQNVGVLSQPRHKGYI